MTTTSRRQLGVADVHPQDSLPSFHIGTVEDDLAIEATGPNQRRIKDFGPVGRLQDDDALLGVEAVQLREELIR
jgi:hypothetical protein